MDENTKGRFYLETYLNDASKEVEGNLKSVVLGKYLWDFDKPSAKKGMYGELSTLLPMTFDNEDITHIFGTPIEGLEILCMGNLFKSNKESKRTFFFSDGHTEDFNGFVEDEHKILLDQSYHFAKQSLRKYSKLYKTKLKSKHIKNMWYQVFCHNLNSPIGREIFLDSQSSNFEDASNPKDCTEMRCSMDGFIESFAHHFATLN